MYLVNAVRYALGILVRLFELPHVVVLALQAEPEEEDAVAEVGNKTC